MRPMLAMLLCAACTPAPAEPFWALDPILLEPAGEVDVTGLQTWEVYSERWGNHLSPRHFLCAVLVQLEGSPRAPDCDGCTTAWDVTPVQVDSDCTEDTAVLHGFTALRAIALTESAPDFATNPPYRQTGAGAWADYGDGWVPYGWAYPASWDQGDDATTLVWNGSEPFALHPAFAWEL